MQYGFYSTQCIHLLTKKSHCPFINYNCKTIPAILLEIKDKQKFHPVTGNHKNQDIAYFQEYQLEMLELRNAKMKIKDPKGMI